MLSLLTKIQLAKVLSEFLKDVSLDDGNLPSQNSSLNSDHEVIRF